MRLQNLKIAQRLALLAGPLLALLVLTSLLGLFDLRTVAGKMEMIGTNAVPSVRTLGKIADVASTYRTREYRYLLDQQRGDGSANLDRLAKLESNMAEARKTYEATIVMPEDKALFQAFSQAWASYVAFSARARQVAHQGKHEAALAMMTGEGQKERDAVIKAIDELSAFNVRESDRLLAESNQQVQRAILTALIVMLVGVAGGVMLALWLARSITRPLGQAVVAADAVAKGDLTIDIPEVKGRDEVSALLNSLRQMCLSLRSVVGDVNEGVASVRTASAEIAVGNQDLSSRTESQASSLQETASAMEELTSTVRSSADTAREASRLAGAAEQVAQQGGAAMSQVVSTMGDISASSRKIGEIIGVIDGIAFQTNILALNAAVEAARAGDQGRGFAVVAGEVRNLAQRSAQAAREIKVLISESVEKVGSGSQQVTAAGRTMEEIVLQVKQVNELIGEISRSTTEQSAGITQVNQAVAGLDQMTQQNAALVEQSAAAAASLSDQSQRLAESVARFKLGREEARAVIDAARRAKPAPTRAALPAKAGAATKPAAQQVAPGEWAEF